MINQAIKKLISLKSKFIEEVDFPKIKINRKGQFLENQDSPKKADYPKFKNHDPKKTFGVNSSMIANQIASIRKPALGSMSLSP